MNQGPMRNGRRADLTKETDSTRSLSKQKVRYNKEQACTDTFEFQNYRYA